MRKGHDFHKDKGGEICQTLGQWGKIPMCLLSLLYPTTFIEEWLLVVEAVIIFGSGVVGLSVLTHTHTPPTVDFTMAGKTFTHSPIRNLTILLFILSHKSSSLHDCAEGSRTSNFHVLPVVCSSMDKNGVVFPHAGPPLSVHSSQGRIVFHAQDFPGFYPRIFPLRIYGWFGCILPSWTDSWVLRCPFHSRPG